MGDEGVAGERAADALGGNREAELAESFFGDKLLRESEFGAGFGGDRGVLQAAGGKAGEGEDAGGLVEGEARAELAGCGADDAAAKCGVEGAQAG